MSVTRQATQDWIDADVLGQTGQFTVHHSAESFVTIMEDCATKFESWRNEAAVALETFSFDWWAEVQCQGTLLIQTIAQYSPALHGKAIGTLLAVLEALQRLVECLVVLLEAHHHHPPQAARPASSSASPQPAGTCISETASPPAGPHQQQQCKPPSPVWSADSPQRRCFVQLVEDMSKSWAPWIGSSSMLSHKATKLKDEQEEGHAVRAVHSSSAQTIGLSLSDGVFLGDILVLPLHVALKFIKLAVTPTRVLSAPLTLSDHHRHSFSDEGENLQSTLAGLLSESSRFEEDTYEECLLLDGNVASVSVEDIGALGIERLLPASLVRSLVSFAASAVQLRIRGEQALKQLAVSETAVATLLESENNTAMGDQHYHHASSVPTRATIAETVDLWSMMMTELALWDTMLLSMTLGERLTIVASSSFSSNCGRDAVLTTTAASLPLQLSSSAVVSEPSTTEDDVTGPMAAFLLQLLRLGGLFQVRLGDMSAAECWVVAASAVSHYCEDDHQEVGQPHLSTASSSSSTPSPSLPLDPSRLHQGGGRHDLLHVIRIFRACQSITDFTTILQSVFVPLLETEETGSTAPEAATREAGTRTATPQQEQAGAMCSLETITTATLLLVEQTLSTLVSSYLVFSRCEQHEQLRERREGLHVESCPFCHERHLATAICDARKEKAVEVILLDFIDDLRGEASRIRATSDPSDRSATVVVALLEASLVQAEELLSTLHVRPLFQRMLQAEMSHLMIQLDHASSNHHRQNQAESLSVLRGDVLQLLHTPPPLACLLLSTSGSPLQTETTKMRGEAHLSPSTRSTTTTGRLSASGSAASAVGCATTNAVESALISVRRTALTTTPLSDLLSAHGGALPSSKKSKSNASSLAAIVNFLFGRGGIEFRMSNAFHAQFMNALDSFLPQSETILDAMLADAHTSSYQLIGEPQEALKVSPLEVSRPPLPPTSPSSSPAVEGGRNNHASSQLGGRSPSDVLDSSAFLERGSAEADQFHATHKQLASTDVRVYAQALRTVCRSAEKLLFEMQSSSSHTLTTTTSASQETPKIPLALIFQWNRTALLLQRGCNKYVATSQGNSAAMVELVVSAAFLAAQLFRLVRREGWHVDVVMTVEGGGAPQQDAVDLEALAQKLDAMVQQAKSSELTLLELASSLLDSTLSAAPLNLPSISSGCSALIEYGANHFLTCSWLSASHAFATAFGLYVDRKESVRSAMEFSAAHVASIALLTPITGGGAPQSSTSVSASNPPVGKTNEHKKRQAAETNSQLNHIRRQLRWVLGSRKAYLQPVVEASSGASDEDGLWRPHAGMELATLDVTLLILRYNIATCLWCAGYVHDALNWITPAYAVAKQIMKASTLSSSTTASFHSSKNARTLSPPISSSGSSPLSSGGTSRARAAPMHRAQLVASLIVKLYTLCRIVHQTTVVEDITTLIARMSSFVLQDRLCLAASLFLLQSVVERFIATEAIMLLWTMAGGEEEQGTLNAASAGSTARRSPTVSLPSRTLQRSVVQQVASSTIAGLTRGAITDVHTVMQSGMPAVTSGWDRLLVHCLVSCVNFCSAFEDNTLFATLLQQYFGVGEESAQYRKDCAQQKEEAVKQQQQPTPLSVDSTESAGGGGGGGLFGAVTNFFSRMMQEDTANGRSPTPRRDSVSSSSSSSSLDSAPDSAASQDAVAIPRPTVGRHPNTHHNSNPRNSKTNVDDDDEESLLEGAVGWVLQTPIVPLPRPDVLLSAALLDSAVLQLSSLVDSTSRSLVQSTKLAQLFSQDEKTTQILKHVRQWTQRARQQLLQQHHHSSSSSSAISLEASGGGDMDFVVSPLRAARRAPRAPSVRLGSEIGFDFPEPTKPPLVAPNISKALPSKRTPAAGAATVVAVPPSSSASAAAVGASSSSAGPPSTAATTVHEAASPPRVPPQPTPQSTDVRSPPPPPSPPSAPTSNVGGFFSSLFGALRSPSPSRQAAPPPPPSSTASALAAPVGTPDSTLAPTPSLMSAFTFDPSVSLLEVDGGGRGGGGLRQWGSFVDPASPLYMGKSGGAPPVQKGGLCLTPSIHLTGIPVDRPPASPLVLRSQSRLGGGVSTSVPLLLDQAMRIGLHDSLPTEFQLRSWFLLYASARHGTSYQAMLHTCATLSQERVRDALRGTNSGGRTQAQGGASGSSSSSSSSGTQFPLIVAFLVQDNQKKAPPHVIGAFLPVQGLLMSPLSKFYGNSAMFVFTSAAATSDTCPSSGLRVYAAQNGSNDYFCTVRGEYMAFGCGRHADPDAAEEQEDGAAIYISQSLGTGSTSACSTFASPPLVGDGKRKYVGFEVLATEVYAIADT